MKNQLKKVLVHRLQRILRTMNLFLSMTCENLEFSDDSDNQNENNKRIIINKIKYFSNVPNSVFNIKCFNLTKENFL